MINNNYINVELKINLRKKLNKAKLYYKSYFINTIYIELTIIFNNCLTSIKNF